MRITPAAFMLTSVLLSASHLVAAGQQTKYGVTVTETKPAALAKAKTYTWTVSQPSFDKTVDQQIIAAVDRELSALGLTKLVSGRGDVQVTYASLRRTDVDLKSEPSTTGARRSYPVGILVVRMRDPANGQMLFSARMDSPIDTEPAKLEAAINAAATAIFEKYPTRTAAKR